MFNSLHADQIGSHHPLEYQLLCRNATQQLWRWERSVEEEADAGIRQTLAKHCGNQHEVVVVDPDGVAWLVALKDLVCKDAVDLQVLWPGVVLVCLSL